MKNILFVASEAVPFMKTGGLADVVGSLPKCFDKRYFDVRVIMPKYLSMPWHFTERLEFVSYFYMQIGNRNKYVGIFKLVHDGITFYFIDNEQYFGGAKPYGDLKFDLEKFSYFSRAALSALPVIGFKPHIVHCHDWQTALVPIYMKDSFRGGDFYRDMKSVLTIHNLKFQGIWDIKTIKELTGLSDYYFTIDKMRVDRDANLLKGGIAYADYITTVSETYAEEIKTEFYGEGLDGLMRARRQSLCGIVNGIDYNEYNPENDYRLASKYNQINWRKEKYKNKTQLQEQLRLEVNKDKFMIGLVSRLTDQKGLDLIAHVMDDLCSDDVQFVILGTGEEKYENMFRYYDWKYGNRVSANIYYSEDMSHKVYAACDAFLMPSLFEPCGLSQLMSLRYGTIPIVRETGGLRDTVQPYNCFESSGTGFSFANYNAHEMLNAVNTAKFLYYNKKREWNKMVDRAMQADFSWTNSARKYENLYNWLLGW